jgi:hypothetical protein
MPNFRTNSLEGVIVPRLRTSFALRVISSGRKVHIFRRRSFKPGNRSRSCSLTDSYAIEHFLRSREISTIVLRI